MRLIAACASIMLCLTACGESSQPAPASPLEAKDGGRDVGSVDSVRIDRARAGVPSGYEFGALPSPADPFTFWGFGPGRTANPAACEVLGDPGVDASASRGWSASGTGGIIYTVVYSVPTAGPLPESVLGSECAQWTAVSGHTTGTFTRVLAPVIEGAQTIGMATVSTTVVEGGTETVSHADTYSAYLGGDIVTHVVTVVVVTDPGSSVSALNSDFASALLVRAVSELRR